MKIFNKALDINDISAVMAERHSCPEPEPVVGYHFEEGQWNGNTHEVVDYASTHHGTAINGAHISEPAPALAGDPGTCSHGTFHAPSSRYLTVPYSNEINIDGSFSVTFWARTQGGIGTYRSAISSRSSTNAASIRKGFNVFAGSNNKWQFWTGTGVDSWDEVSSTDSSSNVIHDTWTHIAVTFESQSESGGVHTGIKSLYVNGELSISQSNRRYIANELNDLLIGAVNNEENAVESATYFFTGRLDEVQIFDESLSPESVSTIYQQRHPCEIPDPIANYRFDECSYTGVGDELIDQTGNFNGSVPQSNTSVPSSTQTATTDSMGAVNRSLDLSLANGTNTADWANLPITAMDGLDDFSISLWVNSTTETNHNCLLYTSPSPRD